MNILIRALKAKTGMDICFTEVQTILSSIEGVHCTIDWVPKWYEWCPWLMRLRNITTKPDLIIAGIEYAWAAKIQGVPLWACTQQCVFRKEYQKRTTLLQKIYQYTLVYFGTAWSLRSADRVIAPTNDIVEATKAVFGKIGHYTVLHNTINTEQFCPNDTSSTLNNSRCKLLFVGNPTMRKGVDLLPKILDLLGDNYELRYTSGMRNSSIPPALKSHPRAIPIGSLSRMQLIAEYRTCDIFLLPTRLEGMSVAVMEAMSCGACCIVSACPGMDELVTHQHSGLLCNVDAVHQFADTIKEVWQQPQYRQALGLQARQTMVKHFSREQRIQEYQALLHEDV